MKKLLLLCIILILTGCTQTGSSNFGDDATLTKLNPWIRSGENVLLSGSSRNIGSTTTPISVMHVLGIDLDGDFKTAWPTGTGSGWATSSSDYWETTKLRWSTTSEDYYWTTNFTSNFNTALNATTTLDLTSLVVTKATTTNFAVSGLVSCDTIDTDASGTLRCGTDNAAAGGTGSNWSFGAASGWLTPSTTIGIIVQASSTITNLTVDNSTTTLKSVIGTDGAGDAVLSLKELWSLGFDDSDGDSFVISSGNALGTGNILKGLATGVTFPENATTTKSFTVSSLTSCDTIDTDANGLFKCGSDNAGAGGTGSNWLFGAAQDFITPSTTVGIILQASSTITSLVVPGSLTGTGVTNAWNALHNATTTYPGFATQFATALNATSTWAGFQSEFNKYLNATSTWTAFDSNWDRKANATTTQTNFAGQFNTALNATTTLDLTTLIVTNATTTNSFHPTALCLGNVCSTAYDGTTACAAGAICTGGHTHVGVNETYGTGWNGDTATPEKDDVYDYLHQMDTDDDGDVDTLNSSILNLLNSDYRISILNATTTNTDVLKVYTGSTLAAATSTNLAVDNLVSCDTIDTDANGTFRCGTDNAGAGGTGSNWVFGVAQDFITPSTTVGIILQASSTITSLVLPGTVSGDGFTNAWNALYNATTTQAGFATQFAAAFNATSTWAGFQSEFNKYLNATTTLDLTTAQIGTLTVGTGITVPADSISDDELNEGDTFEWTALHTWTDARPAMLNATTTNIGTLLVYTASSFPANDITDAEVSNTLTCSDLQAASEVVADAEVVDALTINTSIEGLFTGGARISMLNSTTTNVGTLKVYTGSTLAAATSTNFAVTSLTQCDTIDTDANGTLRCGTDNAGTGGTGSNWIFGAAQDFITPSTTVGIILQASSTITSLVLPGTVSGTGFTNAWNTLYNATTTLNGFTPANYLLTSNFGTQFASAYNATTTLNGFTNNQANWNTAYGWGDHSIAGYYSAANYNTDWANLYNATTTLNGFTPANYLLTTNFDTEWNSNYNATTTLNGLTPWTTTLEQNFWNGTTTWAGFAGQFNTYLNATTTLDLTTLFATNLKSTNATTTKFTVGTTNPTNNYNFFLTGGAYLDSATTTDSLFVTGYASSTVGFRSGGLLDIGGVTTLRGITTTTNTTTIGGGLKVYKNASDSPTTTLEFL